MAMMISVPSRNTDTKKLVKEAIKISTRKYRIYLTISVIINLSFIIIGLTT